MKASAKAPLDPSLPAAADPEDDGPPPAFPWAFLKLAKADSKSSLALAWSTAEKGSLRLSACERPCAGAPAASPCLGALLPLLVGLLSTVFCDSEATL